ncbi:MAG: hypothetical protein PHC61_15115 [Chitinivibrionales bacterium]|nr:hypothetical protein [Chitinivibrionales bacterium]
MKLLHSVVVLSVFITFNLSAGVLFQDNFPNGDNKWVPISAGISTSVANGSLSATNSSATFFGLLQHDMTLPDSFSYSINVSSSSSTYNLLGMAFCLGESGTSATGYVFGISSTQQWLLERLSSTVTMLTSGRSSQILPGKNTLKVVKIKKSMTLYCNGEFIGAFTDTQAVNGGSIGLSVPPSATVQFDNALVSDSSAVKPARTSFSDDFSDGNLDGWYTNDRPGMAVVSQGAAVLTNPSDTSHFIFAQGDFNKASMRAIIRLVSGHSLYGVSFIHFKELGDGYVSNQEISFLIDSARGFAIVNTDSGARPLHQGLKSWINGGSGTQTDTIDVYYRGPYYALYINKDSTSTLDTSAGLNDIQAIGVDVQDSTKIALEYISVNKGDSPFVSVINRRTGNNVHPSTLSNSGISVIYDVRGRKIGALKKGDYKLLKSRFASGTYFLVKKAPSGLIESSPIVIIR